MSSNTIIEVKNKSIAAACVVATVSALMGASGCDTVRAPYTPRADQLPQESYPQISVSYDLQPWIAYSKPVVERGDVLKVSVPVRLTSSGTGEYSNTQYRFIFLDATGSPTRTQPDWRFQRFEPRQQVFLTANSLDSNAVDWRLEIRSAR